MKWMCLVAAVLATVPLHASAKEVIDIRLTADAPEFPADKPVDVTVTFTNISDSPVRLLSDRTPVLEGIVADILNVSLGDKPVDYIGRIYKRPAPTESDYLTLNPGESISGIASLWDNYDLSVSGTYTIRYNTEVLAPTADDEIASSNVITLEIEGREPRPNPDEDELEFETKVVNGSSEKFKGCSEAQKAAILMAREHALNYADDAYDYLVAGSVTSRYTTWFGAYDSSRYSTVRNHFRKIRDVIDNEDIKFYCNCNDNSYAYVIPISNYKVHLCRAFWDAPMTGRDSKAGTLIHEISHFWWVAATNDKGRGQVESQHLAITKPNKAIKNADSHEYFAEDTPYSPYNPCAPTVTSPTGAPITASWDGFNCFVMGTPAGSSPYVQNNRYYVQATPGTSCPAPSWWDTANCYILSYPSWSTSYFVWSGVLYLTPGPGNSCPAPSWFDGFNCYVMPVPAGSTPFKYGNALYITAPPHCPIGSYDGTNCLVGTAPASREAFVWGSAFYYSH